MAVQKIKLLISYQETSLYPDHHFASFIGFKNIHEIYEYLLIMFF